MKFTDKYRYLIWIGCLEPNLIDSHNHAFSPASLAWQRNFVSQCVTFDALSPITIVNKKSFLSGGDLFSSIYSLGRSYRYLNLPIFRDLQISFLSFFLLLSVYKKRTIVVVYNQNLYSKILGFLFNTFSIKWLSIFADGRSVDFSSDYILYLSYSTFNQHPPQYQKSCKPVFFPFPISQPFHLLNSNPPILPSFKLPSKYILYAGSINKWTGILDFLPLFLSSVLSDEYSLVICGTNTLPQPFSDSPKICTLGLLSEEELHFVALNSSAFICPRPNLGIESTNNFPSKLSFYLGYNSPTFSDILSSFDPSLLDIVLSFSSPEHILRVLLDPITLSQYAMSLTNYRKHHTWQNSVEYSFNSLD